MDGPFSEQAQFKVCWGRQMDMQRLKFAEIVAEEGEPIVDGKREAK